MPLDFSTDGPVATLTLNRPEALNAIDAGMRRDLQAAWRRIGEDPTIQVAIVTGAGDRAFSAGADLKSAAAPAAPFASDAFGGGPVHSLTAGMDTDKPLIAAINGHAMGGGLEIALGCDIRIASTNARFALPEVRVGTIPGSGGTQRLPRLVGRSTAMLLMLTGEAIDAAEALRIGLVSRVVDPEALMDAAHGLAATIAANAPMAVRAVKRLVREGSELPLERALALEHYVWGSLRDTNDRREGRAAFAEKRKPRFTGT